jgi:predicted AlkP superfamily phosphohydrolase/phosphomutase
MKNDPADLTAIVFDGVDKLQHLCWRLIDPNLRGEKLLDWEEEMRDYVLEYYHNVDDYIRKTVTMAGEDANVFIASDHGFGPTYYIFHINVLLEKLGYLKWKDEQIPDTERCSHEWSFASLDWDHTTAYVGTPSSNGIRIRAAGELGRNEMPRHEYYALRERLIKELLDYRDPLTGEQIITEVLVMEEAFPGPAMDKAPDLTVVLSDHSFVSIVNEEPVVLRRPKINGTHRPQGVFMAHGPGIVSGGVFEEYSIMDVTPTLLYSLGLPIPADMEGKVAKEAFDPDFIRSHPILTSETAAARPEDMTLKAESPFTNEEKEVIYSQLRALGYMD